MVSDDIPLEVTVNCQQSDLEQLAAYARREARKRLPRHTVHPDTLDLEVDELAQDALIRLWLVTQNEPVLHQESYLRITIKNGSIDMARKYHRHPLVPLPLTEDGEVHLNYENALQGIQSDDLQDPSEAFIHAESLRERVEQYAAGIAELAPQQQEGLLCTLNDQHSEASALLAEALKKYAIELEAHNWPQDERKRQSLKSSRSVARKKLRSTVTNH